MATTMQKPVDWDELYPGRFLKSGELKGRKVSLTIIDVELEELEGNTGKQIKGIVSFKETPKKIPLNKTNGICIRAMFGRKIANWAGKKITLYPGQWNGEECLRIWGSPDIAADMDIMIELPRKKPQKATMHKVVPGARPPADAREPGDE